MRSLKRADRGRMLLGGAKVIKNQKTQKRTIARALGRYNAIAKKIPNANKDAVARSVLVVKKVLGKS